MVKELRDLSSSMFGRDADLAYLRGRAGMNGITAVVGRAQMGKSWLLEEAARRLVEEEDRYLVGFTEAGEGANDLFLRIVSDLYSRWLADATLMEQAQAVWDQQRKDLVGRAGSFFGRIYKTIPGPVKELGDLFKEYFDRLAEAQRKLSSGGLKIASLQSEDAREVLKLVQSISGRQIVLVLDQWEQSPLVESESNFLRVFLRHMSEWPPCHIVIGLQPVGAAYESVIEMRDGQPEGWVEVHELLPMDLEDGATSAALLGYLRERVPAARGASDAELLELIAGYPSVVYRWLDSHNAHLNTLADLKKLADDANKYRYREFDKLLPGLSNEERSLAMRCSPR